MEREERRLGGCPLGIALALAAGLVISARGWAQEIPKAKKVVLDLPQAVKLAVMVSPEVKQFKASVAVAEAKKEQADAGRFPQFDLTSVLGPSPRARFTEDAEGRSSIATTAKITEPAIDGIFGRAEFTLVQPLYTFGKLSSLREAAGQGVKVELAKTDEKISEIVLRTKKLYYDLLLAQEIKGLVADIEEQLEKTLEKVERQLAAGAPGVDEVDRYKLRTFRGELKKGIAELERGMDVAREALKTLVGLQPEQELELSDKVLRPVERPAVEVEKAVAEAKELRPEFTQIRAGLLATQALVEAARADFYPQLFVALNGDYARATNRSFMKNPFLIDVFNHNALAPLLGFKWHFDFGITSGKVAAAQAELLKLQHTKEFAEKGIPLQVIKAYRELQEAQEAIRATEEGYLNARRWLVAAVANFDLGIGEAKDVADALTAYGRLRADNFRAIYNFNLSLANLDHATGKDVLEAK